MDQQWPLPQKQAGTTPQTVAAGHQGLLAISKQASCR